MTTLPRSIVPIYNPDLLTKAQLIDNFVVRTKKYEKLIADIRGATMENPEQHIMIVGLRGMGKTTLLRRLAYEVENDSTLNKWLIPIIFNEEEYGITKLFKLWETIAEYLEKQDKAFEGLYGRMDAAYTRLKGDHHRYESEAFDLLMEALHAQQKKILLFIDNFGEMFRRFKKPERQRLREILMTCPDLRIIAASAVVIEAFFKNDDPLYEFFKTERLEGLNPEETKALLYKLGEGKYSSQIERIITQQPERVEALRRLTGGIPRSIVLFFEIFVSDQNGSAFSDLENILDHVTGIYKHRMDDLPTQQQEILQVLALNYDGATAREVANRTRLETKLVSSQLKQMQKENLVSVANPGAKNQVYYVYDRFFNIWFLMRMARKSDKSRVLWLVRFMECWCTPEDLTKRGDRHRKTLNNTEDYNPQSAYMFSTALFYADQEGIESRYQMTRKTRDYLRDQSPDLHAQTDKSDIAVFGRGMDHLRCRDWEAAHSELSAIEDKNAQEYLLLYVLDRQKGEQEQAEDHLGKAQKLLKSSGAAERIIGTIYNDYIKDWKIAERYWQQSSALGDRKGMQFLGGIFKDHYKDFEKAKVWYNKAIDAGETLAWINLGDMYCNNLYDYNKAEICYQKAALEGYAIAWQHLGDMYVDYLTNYEQAEVFYKKAIEAGETFAWVDLGTMYADDLTNYSQAEVFYKKAIEEGESMAWVSLGNMYNYDLKNYKQAEAFYNKAVEAGEPFAWVNLGNMYKYDLKNYEQADFFYKKAIEAGYTYVWETLGDMYRNNLSDYTEAEICYQKAASEGHAIAWQSLGNMYADDLKNYEQAEFFYKIAIEAGITNVWITMGNMFQYTLSDYTRAESCYQKAASEGYVNAWQSLGNIYADDLKNYKKAEFFYKKAIEAGETDVWDNLGDMYCNNLKDYTQAEICYQKAATAGHAIGWRSLGDMYADDLENYEQADFFYKKAIEAGQTDVWEILGDMYRKNLSDYTQAETCYQKAGTAGHTNAWQSLGNMYAGDLKNYEQAEFFYKKAIEAGKTFVWEILGNMYRNNLSDYTHAETCYQNAASAGHAISWWSLGDMYAGDLKNYEQAEFFYKKAIEAGQTFVWDILGNMYRNNLSDYAQAETCYQNAASAGHAISWCSLGMMYAGDLKNYEQAEFFYKKAIEAGQTYWWAILGNMYQNNLDDYTQAEICYQRAAAEGHAIGWYFLGSLYTDYIKDYEKAEAFYKKAIEAGDKYAQNSLAWFYFTLKIKPQEALIAAQKAYELNPAIYVAHTLACIQLWNEQYEWAHVTAEHFLYDEDFLEEGVDNSDLLDYFLLLIAKNQHAFLHEYFSSERGLLVRAKERFLMIWYALVSEMKVQYPLEYLRIPSELQSTINEILDKIELMRKQLEGSPNPKLRGILNTDEAIDYKQVLTEELLKKHNS